jgi:hypothetical protein
MHLTINLLIFNAAKCIEERLYKKKKEQAQYTFPTNLTVFNVVLHKTGNVYKLQILYWVMIFNKQVKVKVKVTLQQAMKAQRGSRDIALLFP